MKILFTLTFLITVFVISNCSDANKGANLTTSNTTAINTANINSMKPAATPGSDTAGGQELFKKNCAACHRETGMGGKITIEGRTINPDNLVSDRKKAAPDEKFYKWITNGVPDEGMPAFKEKLTEEQITEIVQYIRTGLQNQ